MVSPLVSCVWLRQQLTQGLKNLRLIDGSWHMKSSGRNAEDDYNKQRINGAVFVDIDELSDHSTDIPHMLPSKDQFSEHIGKLGITNNHHVIVYEHNEEYGMFSSARLWWMFKAFGHSDISILDGGLSKWLAEGLPVSTDDPNSITPVNYSAIPREDLVKNMNEVIEALRKGDIQVVDARSDKRYHGTAPEPRPDLPSGHMKGSFNLPFYKLFNPETNTLASKQVIQEEFSHAGVDLNKPIIATCGSGVTACWIAFAASLLGKDIPVYDGSWTEYAQKGPQDTLHLGQL